MAEGLFRELVKGRGDYQVASAGIGAYDGAPPSKHTSEILKERGVDVSTMRSQFLTPDLMLEATHIVCMSRHHLQAIVMDFPEVERKCYLATEFMQEDRQRNRDISDPFGGSRRDYDGVRDTLEKALPCLLAFIDAEEKARTGPLKAAEPTAEPTPAATTSAGLASPTPMSATPTALAIGSDHGGLALKEHLVTYLRSQGHSVADVGTHGISSVDYPDFAEQVTGQVLTGDVQAGILVCTTGIGMSISANRHKGIQASLVHDIDTAKITREHNNSNVLVLAGASTSTAEGQAIVDAWLSTPFAGGRHGRRVDKMNPSPTEAPVTDILAAVDPAVAAVVAAEQQRQQNNIELIASENFTSRAVMAAQGSCLTNKYAEGYPAKRWYGNPRSDSPPPR